MNRIGAGICHDDALSNFLFCFVLFCFVWRRQGDRRCYPCLCVVPQPTRPSAFACSKDGSGIVSLILSL